MQYLDNHEPQRFDFCIDNTSTDRTCQLYNHQMKIMIFYEGANILVSGAFLKCFIIFSCFSCLSHNDNKYFACLLLLCFFFRKKLEVKNCFSYLPTFFSSPEPKAHR